jgi:quaternary ammonium compound-resistance protein SugE
MGWIYLLLAGACEMVWPLGFKYTHGFRDHYWAIGGTVLVMITSFGLMSLATNRGGIAVGTAYAVWTGLGATGTVLLGMSLFHEPRDAWRLACLSLIILGVVGLKLHERLVDTGSAVPVRPATGGLVELPS